MRGCVENSFARRKAIPRIIFPACSNNTSSPGNASPIASAAGLGRPGALEASSPGAARDAHIRLANVSRRYRSTHPTGPRVLCLRPRLGGAEPISAAGGCGRAHRRAAADDAGNEQRRNAARLDCRGTAKVVAPAVRRHCLVSALPVTERARSFRAAIRFAVDARGSAVAAWTIHAGTSSFTSRRPLSAPAARPGPRRRLPAAGEPQLPGSVRYGG